MRTHAADYSFIILVFAITVFGLIALNSASNVLSNEIFGESYYYLGHQIIFGLSLGTAGFLIAQRVSYRTWQKLAFPIALAGLALLAIVFMPGLGFSYGEARRWLVVGPMTIQPFEVFKPAMIIYLAALLSRKGDAGKVMKESFVPFFVIFGAAALLLALQPNMSAVVFIFLIAALLYFLAGINLAYLFAVGGLALLSFFGLIKSAPYRMQRWTVFMHPEIDPLGIGYQINQALLAIGSGGMFGLGLGHSVQKWKYLPEPIGDSIFAIIAEELGLFGAGLLIALFVLLAWRGFVIARRAPDRFGFLLATGITGWFFFQAFINMAAISGIIPLTGMPMPFVSYGGSALAVALTASGIIVNVSKFTK